MKNTSLETKFFVLGLVFFTNTPPRHDKSVQKFVSDLLQVGGFLRVLRFPPPYKTDHHNVTGRWFSPGPPVSSTL